MERDPELEQSLEDFTFKGAGEGERYESPREGEWFVARLSHGDELGSFLLLAGVQSSVTLHLGEGKRGDEELLPNLNFIQINSGIAGDKLHTDNDVKTEHRGRETQGY